jgi:hypothetical protein
MEVALLLGYVAVLSIGFVLVALAFTLANNLTRQTAVSPLPRWFMASGAYLAAVSSLLILLVPGMVPWWDSSPSDYANRLLIALGGGILALVAIGLANIGGRNRKSA